MNLAYSPVEWLRVGMAAQRTRVLAADLDVQRGLLVGVSHGRFDITTYVSSPGWTAPKVVDAVGVKSTP